MNRTEFMRQLEMLLSDISETERADALKYYNDYFDDAGYENEASVIEELGSAEQIAANIKSESGYAKTNDTWNQTTQDQPDMNRSYYSAQGQPNMNQGNYQGYYSSQGQPYVNPQPQEKKMDGSKMALIVILIIITFPLWVGIIGGLFGLMLGMFGVMIGFIVGGVGLVIGGIALSVASIVKAFVFPMGGVFLLGISLLLIAIGLLLLTGGLAIMLGAIPAIARGIASLCRKVFGKEGEVA